MADSIDSLNTATWSPELRAEMTAMTSTQRAAVLMIFVRRGRRIRHHQIFKS